MEKKLKIYLDTSVINFLFADDAPDLKKITIDFFDNYLENYNVEISEIVISEIGKTKDNIKQNILFDAINRYKIPIKNRFTTEIADFAWTYIDSAIIPRNKLED